MSNVSNDQDIFALALQKFLFADIEQEHILLAEKQFFEGEKYGPSHIIFHNANRFWNLMGNGRKTFGFRYKGVLLGHDKKLGKLIKVNRITFNNGQIKGYKFF